MTKDWVPSIASIDWTRNYIAGLAEGALWVIPNASTIMKISHLEKNFSAFVGKNQTDEETINMDKSINILEIVGYKLASVFVDEADITVYERLEHIKHWALD